jgi:hypothetical protein
MFIKIDNGRVINTDKIVHMQYIKGDLNIYFQNGSETHTSNASNRIAIQKLSNQGYQRFCEQLGVKNFGDSGNSESSS